MKNFLILLFSILIVFNGVVFAQAGEPEKKAAIPEETVDVDIDTNETAAETFHEEYVYHFPEIKPEFSGSIGYGFIDHNDSARAGEFEYLHSSIIAGGKFIAFPFPHRLHLEFDYLNKKDYFGDLRYAYKDLILFRGLGRSVFHNLDNRILTEFGTSYTVTAMDTGEKYGVTKSLNNLFLRFKTPNFPFHVYIGGNFIDKEGTRQQRFLANYSSNVNRTSQKREVDWSSRDIIAGVNSHIGPVEMDISHSEKRLTVNGDRILENNYGAGTLPHNLLPETKGSATTLKLHTSTTGRLVASATFSWIDRKNEESRAKADYFIGAGDITYMLHERLTFFAKYRHKEVDVDNPDILPAGYLGYSTYTSAITGIRPSLSSTMDMLSGTVRYRPIKRMTLNAEYIHERTDRDNSDEWRLSKVTVRDAVSLSVSTRIIEKLNLRAKYTHQEIDAPAYNVQPDGSDEGKVSLSWSPLKWATGILSYSITKEKREKIYYIDNMGLQVPAENREGLRNRLLGSITFIVSNNLSITPSYAYMCNKIEQDLVYDNTPGYHTDSNVQYKDRARVYAVNLNYIPEKKINLNADVSYTESKGNFSPGGILSGVTSLSDSEVNAKIRETSYTVRGDYEFIKDWGLGMKYNYVNYNDVLNNSNDGSLHAVLMMISKKW